MFPKIARINHSCLPNCIVYYNNYPTNGIILKSLVHITKNTEITIGYLPKLVNVYNERQKILSKKWKFNCNCIELCQKNLDNIIKEYRICKMNSFGNAITCLNALERCLTLLKEYFNDYPIIKAKLMMNASKICMENYMYDDAFDYIDNSLILFTKIFGKFHSINWLQNMKQNIILLKQYSKDNRCDLLLKKCLLLETKI